MKIAVLHGGWSHESLLCAADKVAESLRRQGHEVAEFDCGAEKFLPGLLAYCPEMAFLASHGVYHEDGRLQGLLDWYDIPYNGSSLAASAIGMNKVLFKRLLTGNAICSTPFLVAEVAGKKPEYEQTRKFLDSESLILKPACGGASVGLRIVQTERDFDASVAEICGEYGDCIVEPRLLGQRELSVVLHDFGQEITALPVCEVLLEGKAFDFAMKNGYSSIRKKIPAQLSDAMAARACSVSKSVYDLVGAQGVARVDLLKSANGQMNVLEIKTLPGLMPQSIVPAAFRSVGVEFDQMIEKILMASFLPKRFHVPKKHEGKPLLGNS